MTLKEIIIRLSEAAGPSGREDAAMEVVEELLRPLVDDIRSDAMGNRIALKKCADAAAPTVMLDAHMDEIGLIVTGYEKGFLRFQPLGGVDARMLPALEVKLLTDEPLYGVIDTLPPHILSAEEREKPLPVDKLYIDVGLEEEEVKRRVPLGTPAVFTTKCFELGENRLCGKAMDDRSCAAILIRALQLLEGQTLGCHVALLFAVQEEVGCRGAVTGAYGVAPEAAIAVDVTHGQSPDAPKNETFVLGGGPAIGVGPNATRSVSDKLTALAAAAGMDVQIEVIPGHSGTDAWPIQISRVGVATGVLSLPLRYMHTPVEVLDLRDAENCAKLLALWLADYGKEGV
ncbi:MAG: M42 family metallopeptidase [Ruminococcaceae bacterium]|nr:M42 family metallopeptidase [Oscillospiraceae bacterium]